MAEPIWSAEQCEKLNEWQACGWVHEFTCPTAHAEGRALVATQYGWRCPSCDYRQNWAHDFMFQGAPPNPIAALLGPRKDGASPQITPTDSTRGNDHD